MNQKHKPRKRFGQHFLTDQNVIAKIVQAINPNDGEHLVEIGPGLGALTTAILPISKKLDAIEFDRDVIPKLARICADLGKLHIHQADALNFDFASLRGDGPKLRVIGNLPYNISSPLLFHLIPFNSDILDMHFMLQKEIVARMAAKPNNKTYGRLSVMMQYHYHIDMLFTVMPDAFEPPPKVDSAIVSMRPVDKLLPLNDYSVFATIVRQAFNQRRKILLNSLKDFISEEQFNSVAISPKLRPENLTLEEFVKLANIV